MLAGYSCGGSREFKSRSLFIPRTKTSAGNLAHPIDANCTPIDVHPKAALVRTVMSRSLNFMIVPQEPADMMI
jgi:hypothetical protein